MARRSRQVAKLAADSAGADAAKASTAVATADDTRTTAERRIDEVVEMMTSFRWVPGPSHRALAKTWGVSVSMVEHVAAEASRVVRRLVRTEQKEEVAARLTTNIELIGARAMTRTRRRWRRTIGADGKPSYVEYVQPDPDFGSALRAQELAAKLLGLLAPDFGVTIAGNVGAITSGVVILPAETPVQSYAVETSGEAVEPKKLNGNGANGGSR